LIYFVGPDGLFEPEGYEKATIEDCYEYCKDKKALGLDTETTGLDFIEDRVVMLQIGDEANQFVIDTRHIDPSLLFTILSSESIVKVLANAKFDALMLRSTYGVELENVYDIQLVERILHTGNESVSFGLDSMVHRYLNKKLDKNVRTDGFSSTLPFSAGQIFYGAQDIEYLLTIGRLQHSLVQKFNLQHVVLLENAAVLAFADIEFNGLKIDPEAWIKLYQEALRESREIEEELDNILVRDSRFKSFVKTYVQADMFIPAEDLRKIDVNWSSPTQVLKVLRAIDPNLAGVNAKVDLAPLRGKHPLIDTYIQYKEMDKKVSSYGDKFLEKYVRPDGKIHTSFFQILETGRVSSKGPNMQQIPADNRYRNCFVPSHEGWRFVSSDYSSQELCIIAYGSNDPVWIQALNEGKDLHSVCAELVFGDKWNNLAEPGCAYMESKSKCNCKEHKKLRNFVKTINFGLAYGMTEHKLSAQLQIPLDEAKALITKYFSSFPSIGTFLNKLGNFAVANGYITTYPPFLRRRWFGKDYLEDYKLKGEVERAGKNTPIQGTAADMTKLAMVMIRKEVKRKAYPVNMVMVVHDQIDTECPEYFAETWRARMTEIMEEAAKTIIQTGILKADTQISEVWEK